MGRKVVALTIALVLVVGGCSRALAVNRGWPIQLRMTRAELHQRQADVHTAAEILRELGFTEDSRAIRALQKEWWRCFNELGEANMQYIGDYNIVGYLLSDKESDENTPYMAPMMAGCTVAIAGMPFGTLLFIDGIGYFEVRCNEADDNTVRVPCLTADDCVKVAGTRGVYVVPFDIDE